MRFFKYVIALCSLLAVLSCSKDEDVEIKDSKWSNITVDAHEYHIWKYYKFTDNAVFELVGDGVYNLEDKKYEKLINDALWAKRKDWDIAFNQYNIRTNSGNSGLNEGGICETAIQDMTQLADLNLSKPNFVSDKKGIDNIILSLNTMPPPQASVSMSELHPVQIIMTTMPPKYAISNNVFVLKTLNGLVGFKVNNFYNKKGKVGFINIDYTKIK